jgi:hypothetical protein
MEGIHGPSARPPVGPDATDGRGAAPYDVDADEKAATDARRRYLSEPMASLAPDAVIAKHLAPGEEVLAVRPCVAFEQRSGSASGMVGGRAVLSLTTRRIILYTEPMVEIDLDDIQEVLVASGRLLLVLRDGAGVVLETELPRLLRVEIATARAAARR